MLLYAYRPLVIRCLWQWPEEPFRCDWDICILVQKSRCYDVLDYDLIHCTFSWRDISLITMVPSSSQSNGDIHLAYWSKSSTKSSSLVTWCHESWFSSSLPCVIIACTTLFTDSSDEGALPCWFYGFFWRLYFSPNLLKKCFMSSILTDTSLKQ